MNYIDSFCRAGRSLKSAKGRTILTSLAIAVGAFTLTAALAAGTGARQYADKLIKSNVDPQSVFVAKDPSMFGEGNNGPSQGLKEYSESATSMGGMTYKTLSTRDIELMQKTPGVKSVAPTYIVEAKYVQFQGSDKKYTSQITAYDSNVRAERAAGNMPKLGEQLGENEAIIPESYAENLSKKPSDVVGKTITLHIAKSITPPSQEQIQQAFMTGGSDAVEK